MTFDGGFNKIITFYDGGSCIEIIGDKKLRKKLVELEPASVVKK